MVTPPPPSSTPSAQPIAGPSGAMNAATALIALHEQLVEEKKAVNAAAQEVSKHKQGGDNPRAWENLAKHHGRFQAVLCMAVGLDARVPDFHEEADTAAKKLQAAGGGAIVPAKRGEFVRGSFKETMSWIFLNLGGRTKVEGHTSWVPVDPDFEGSNQMIGTKLDETAKQVLEALKKEHEEETKAMAANQPATREYHERAQRISQLEEITGFKRGATGYNKQGTQYAKVSGTYARTGKFAKLVRNVDDEIEVLDKDWARRRRRDFGVGAWGLNRHDERNPDDMFLFGALAAKLGVHVNSFKVIFGLDHPRFQVISQVHYDEKTGKPTYTGHITGIPLFNSKGIQRCAGMLVAMAYANDYKGTPMLEKSDEPEMIDDPKNPGQKIAKTDEKGNIVYKNKLDERDNVIIARDEKGNVKYEPLSQTQRDAIMKKPFPSFTLPGGYPDHALDFFFDMIVQHQKMGGAPPICGFNPNASTPEGMFDARQLEEACGQMKDTRTRSQFMQKLYQGAKDAYFPAAIKKWEENIRNPKVYEAARGNEVYALERILKKNPELDPRDPKDQNRALTNDDVAAFKAGVVKGQLGAPTQKQAEDRANRLRGMQKKELNDEEKKEVLGRHMAIPDVPPGKGQRTRIEEEMTRVAYMDTSGTVAPSAKRELEVNSTKTPAEQRELQVAQEKQKGSALQVIAGDEQAKLDDLLAKQADNPGDTALSIEVETQKKLVEKIDAQLLANEVGIDPEADDDMQMVIDHIVLGEDVSVADVQDLLLRLHGQEGIRQMAARLKAARVAGNPLCVKLENGKYEVKPIDKSSALSMKIETKLRETESLVERRSAATAKVAASGRTVKTKTP